MKTEPVVNEIYRKTEERQKSRAKRPISEKLAVAKRLRDLQKSLAPLRAANRAKRAAENVDIRIKTR